MDTRIMFWPNFSKGIYRLFVRTFKENLTSNYNCFIIIMLYYLKNVDTRFK